MCMLTLCALCVVYIYVYECVSVICVYLFCYSCVVFYWTAFCVSVDSYWSCVFITGLDWWVPGAAADQLVEDFFLFPSLLRK